MEPTAPDLQLVPEVTKAVSVSAPDPGPCRTAVIAVVGISMAIVTLGVLSVSGRKKAWVLGCKRTSQVSKG